MYTGITSVRTWQKPIPLCPLIENRHINILHQMKLCSTHMMKTSLSQINRQAKLPFPFNLQSPPFPFNLQAPGMGVEGIFRPGAIPTAQRSVWPGCGGVVRHGRWQHVPAWVVPAAFGLIMVVRIWGWWRQRDLGVQIWAVPRWGYGFWAKWFGLGGGNMVPHGRYRSGPAWALVAFSGLGSADSVQPGRCCRSSGGAAMVQIFQLG
jgi:hypothetical protein